MNEVKISFRCWCELDPYYRDVEIPEYDDLELFSIVYNTRIAVSFDYMDKKYHTEGMIGYTTDHPVTIKEGEFIQYESQKTIYYDDDNDGDELYDTLFLLSQGKICLHSTSFLDLIQNYVGFIHIN